MHLSSGTRVGPYEIAVPLGAGGMGVVYRARDTKLGRDVAIKVLSETFTQDPQRMARFEREARALASLNHPHIASIYGIEDSTELRCLVLELVEGITLAERLKQGAVPVPDALRIALQVAEAVEYAHERGIIHRDLKPANIGLTQREAVKVLDFGLAKAVAEENSSADLSSSPTISHLATQAGVILGTAAYMSPEQAKGRAADRRADIWAFGCVLLEMLTGKPAFGGETLTDTLAAVVLREPDWSDLPTSAPRAIQDLLRRCLKKDARQRLQSIGDARIAIEDVLSGTVEDFPLPASPSRPRWLSVLPWSLLIVVSIVLVWFIFGRPAAPTRGHWTSVLFAGTDIHDAAIAPDGKNVVFEHDGKLWIRSVDELEPTILVGTEGGHNAFWSPDSKSIGYFQGGELRRISSRGGASTLICQIVPDRQFGGATWGRDDHVVFQDIPNGLFEVSAQGGVPHLFTKPDASQEEFVLRDPHFLGDGKTLVMIIRRKGPGLQLDTIAVQNGTQRSVVLRIPGSKMLHIVSSEATGHLLFFMASSPNPGVWAVPFSFAKLTTTGNPFLVRANSSAPSVSSQGNLVYTSGAVGSEELVWTDRTGKVLSSFGSPKTDMRAPVISPDSSRVALDSASTKWQVWVEDSMRNTATPIGGALDDEGVPMWLGSGKDLVFSCKTSGSSQANTCIGPADGSKQPHPILDFGLGFTWSLSPDGKMILFAKQTDSHFEIWRSGFERGAKAQPFLTTQFNQLAPRVSPDGRFVAYQSDESGRYEVYVTPFPTGEQRWLISTRGGTNPKWSRTGNELFYLQGDTLISTQVRTIPFFSVGVPQQLFSGRKVGSTMLKFYTPLWDVAPDGKRFVVIRDAEAGARAIVAEQGWDTKSEQ